MLPTSIQILHEFENHKHPICISKTENHIHEKNLDCEFHLAKQSNPFLFNNSFSLTKITNSNNQVSTTYNFLKNHYQLSFSSRGPPQII